MICRTRPAIGAALLASVLTLVACSVGAGEESSGASGSSSLASSTASTQAASDTAGTQVPGDEASSSGSAVGDDDDWTQARQVPVACSTLSLRPGARLDGQQLGQCVAQSLEKFGSGRMEITGDIYGSVEFTVSPTSAFSGSLSGPDGPASLTSIEGQMWLDTGAGPVEANAQSADEAAKRAGLTAELYGFFSNPELAADLVSVQPEWVVDQVVDSVSLPDGRTMDSYRILSESTYLWRGMPVSGFILWFSDGWYPVGNQVRVETMGNVATHGQKYYDLGAPVEISTP